jgi:ABC-2 type transport system permease protein
MKVIDIALKDLLRSMRSALFWVFAFLVPFLTAGLFYFAFGGIDSEDEVFDLPTTQVQVVNLDQAVANFSVGDLLVEILTDDGLAELIEVAETGDAEVARRAVDRQEAQVAVIIPARFTAAMFSTDGMAAIDVYQDPTLTLGPSIVKGLIGQLVDGFSGARIAGEVTEEQMAEYGAQVDAVLLQAVALQYGEWAGRLGGEETARANAWMALRAPSGKDSDEDDLRVGVISLVMAGMMVFYVFFTGAASAQSILQEEEEGTLARQFTTPTPQSTILGGKLIAVFATLIFQVLVLVILSALIFGINWGKPGRVTLVAAGTVVLSAAFGILVSAFLKDTKQGGVVYGGVLTVLGMIGMSKVFTAGATNPPQAMEIISLLTPHGWGVRGWILLLEGGKPAEILTTVGIMLLLAVAFFTLGVLKFRKRFA